MILYKLKVNACHVFTKLHSLFYYEFHLNKNIVFFNSMYKLRIHTIYVCIVYIHKPNERINI